MHEMSLVSNKSCISQWIIHISPRRICNPACAWLLAQYEWSLSFSINALSCLLLSSWRAEPDPTEPLKEQLQDHRNANCHAPLGDDGQMWMNWPIWGYFLPAWQEAMTVSWDLRRICIHTQTSNTSHQYPQCGAVHLKTPLLLTYLLLPSWHAQYLK